MTPTEIFDSLEKEFAQLQINLQAHIQIKQIFNAMRQNLDSKNGKQLRKKPGPKPKEEKDE